MNKKVPSKRIILENGRKLFQSKAYLSLTGKAAQVLGILWCRRKMTQVPMGYGRQKEWIIGNNSHIVFTYKKADEKYAISNNQYNRALDQLVNRGFINIKPGYPLKFELIDNWLDYGTDNFKPGKRHKTPLPFKKPRTFEEKMEFYSRFEKKPEKCSLIVVNLNGSLE